MCAKIKGTRIKGAHKLKIKILEVNTFNSIHTKMLDYFLVRNFSKCLNCESFFSKKIQNHFSLYTEVFSTNHFIMSSSAKVYSSKISFYGQKYFAAKYKKLSSSKTLFLQNFLALKCIRIEEK